MAAWRWQLLRLLLLLLRHRVWVRNASVLSNTTAMFFQLYVYVRAVLCVLYVAVA